jgi:hypothetical protein
MKELQRNIKWGTLREHKKNSKEDMKEHEKTQ